MNYKPIIFSTPMVQAITSSPDGFTIFANKFKPKYDIGDILWVRETWRMYEKAVGKGEGFHVKRFFAYKADEDNPNVPKCNEWYSNIRPISPGLNHYYSNGSWRSSAIMPKEAARTFVLVKGVRVERLQDITINDIRAEGLTSMAVHAGDTEIAFAEMKLLWDSLNAKRGYGWDTNPFVWVYEFERCEKPDGWPR